MIDTDETGRYKKRTDSDISKTENDLINKIIIVILFSIMFVGDIILMYLAYLIQNKRISLLVLKLFFHFS